MAWSAVPDFRRGFVRLAALDSTARLALARAVAELLGARLRLVHSPARDLIGPRPGDPATDEQKVAEIGLAIRRMAARVPWRSDCLVQALAAQHWLEREGIGSTIHVGVDYDESRPLDAHAWLTAGDQIVVGGDVGRYARLG